MTLAVISIAIAWRTGFVAGASLERAKSNACCSRGSLLSCDGRCGLADILDRLRVQLPAQPGRRIGKRRMTDAGRSRDNVARYLDARGSSLPPTSEPKEWHGQSADNAGFPRNQP